MIVVSQRTAENVITLLLDDGKLAVLSFATPGFRAEVSLQEGAIAIGKVVAGGKGIAVFAHNEFTFVENARVAWRARAFMENRIFACVGEHLLYCQDACAVGVLSAPGHRRPFCRTASRVVNLGGDASFKIVIVATIDCFLHVYNFFTGAIVRSTQLNGEARMIRVTPNWGYILTMVNNCVTILNVNGLLLKQTVVSAWIDRWFTFSAMDGSDGIAFTTTGQQFGIFPAFRPENATQFYEFQERTRDVVFDRNSASFVVISEGGCINVLPHP
jgi:hypothetical protein